MRQQSTIGLVIAAVGLRLPRNVLIRGSP